MITSLRIQNFKGWKDTGKINFAPITLFLGSNSSGKSSIGQFLMLLKQSASSSDRQTVLFLGYSSSVIELGGPNPNIYNGSDTDWWDYREALEEEGIHIVFLSEEYMKAKSKGGKK